MNLISTSTNNKTSFLLKIGYEVLLPLFLGILIYLFFRSNNLLVLDNLKIRASVSMPDLILYNLPDGLWLLSFLQAYKIIWKNNIRMIIIGSSFITLLSIYTEFLQYIGFISGIGDPLDVALYFISFIFFLFINLNNNFS